MGRDSGLGRRIRAARQAAGLTGVEAATKTGVKQQQWNSWENQGVVPSDRHRHRMAEVLQIELTELLTWIAEEYRQRQDETARQLAEVRRDREELMAWVEKQFTRIEGLADQLTDQVSRLEDRHKALEADRGS